MANDNNQQKSDKSPEECLTATNKNAFSSPKSEPFDSSTSLGERLIWADSQTNTSLQTEDLSSFFLKSTNEEPKIYGLDEDELAAEFCRIALGIKINPQRK